MTEAIQEKAEYLRLLKTEGSTNKEYRCYLEPKDGGWIVYGRNGRRGSTLTLQLKTKEPVSYAQAKKDYDALVKEKKVKKGYTEDETGTPFQGVEMQERFSGILPQLLNEIDDSQVRERLNDDDWVLQHKHNGHRRMIARKAGEEILGIKRNGKVVALPLSVVDGVKKLPAGTLVDGEMMGELFVAFDLVEFDGKDLRSTPFIERHRLLTKVLAQTANVIVTPIFVGTAAKLAEFNRINDAKLEGVVLRHKDALYESGRPSSGGVALKYVFFATSTFIVMGISKAKRSVEVGVLNVDGVLVSHGKVTVPSNHEVPGKEDLVDVAYMHAFMGGGLHISKYQGKRDDISRSECTMERIKYKPADLMPEDGDDADEVLLAA